MKQLFPIIHALLAAVFSQPGTQTRSTPRRRAFRPEIENLCHSGPLSDVGAVALGSPAKLFCKALSQHVKSQGAAGLIFVAFCFSLTRQILAPDEEGRLPLVCLDEDWECS